MKFGLFDHLDTDGVAAQDLYEQRLGFYASCDDHGFHALHIAEHHATPLGAAPSPNVFLASLAQRTQKLRFGAMVYCLPFYNPVRLLEEIAMLDHLSKGRLEVGVGRGISPFEGRYLGVDPDLAVAQFQEALSLLKLGFAEDVLDFSGTHYTVVDMPIVTHPVQKPHPPLWYGVVTPDSAERCAKDGMSILTNRGGEAARAITDAYRSAAVVELNAVGSGHLMGITRHIVIDEDEDRARKKFDRAYQIWRAGFLKLWERYDALPPNVRLPETGEGFIAAGQAHVGSPIAVADAVRADIEATGVNYFVARFAFGDLSAAAIALSRDHFVDQLMS